jgi:GntR family transcriptional regulator/GntR family frlABCD operon transcriptional regulator
MDSVLYKKLHSDLKSRIISGIYKEEDILPSEHELRRTYSVTRTTVRQALDELVKEGYITKKQGKGSIVCKRQRRTLGLLSVKGFSQVVSENRQSVKTIMIDHPVISKWPDPFFYNLDEIEKEGCIYLKRLRCVIEEPVMLETSYIPNIGLPGFCDVPFVNGSLFETLNVNYHIEITNVEQDLRAVLADEETAGYFSVPVNSPILHIYLKFFTNYPHVSIYSSLLCNTANYSIGNIL